VLTPVLTLCGHKPFPTDPQHEFALKFAGSGNPRLTALKDCVKLAASHRPEYENTDSRPPRRNGVHFD